MLWVAPKLIFDKEITISSPSLSPGQSIAKIKFVMIYESVPNLNKMWNREIVRTIFYKVDVETSNKLQICRILLYFLSYIKGRILPIWGLSNFPHQYGFHLFHVVLYVWLFYHDFWQTFLSFCLNIRTSFWWYSTWT